MTLKTLTNLSLISLHGTTIWLIVGKIKYLLEVGQKF